MGLIIFRLFTNAAMTALAMFSILLATGQSPAFAGNAQPRRTSAPQPNAATAPASSPIAPMGQPIAGDKPIEIRGQARGAGLFRMSGDKFQIKFVKIRKDYSEEILRTPY